MKLYTRAIDGSGDAKMLSKPGDGSIWDFTVFSTNHVYYIADDDKSGRR